MFSNICSVERFLSQKLTAYCRLVAKGRELDAKLKELEAQAEVQITIKIGSIAQKLLGSLVGLAQI